MIRNSQGKRQQLAKNDDGNIEEPKSKKFRSDFTRNLQKAIEAKSKESSASLEELTGYLELTNMKIATDAFEWWNSKKTSIQSSSSWRKCIFLYQPQVHLPSGYFVQLEIVSIPSELVRRVKI